MSESLAFHFQFVMYLNCHSIYQKIICNALWSFRDSGRKINIY